MRVISCTKNMHSSRLVSNIKQAGAELFRAAFYSCPLTMVSYLKPFPSKSKHYGLLYYFDKCDLKATQTDNLKNRQRSECDGVRYSFDLCNYETNGPFSIRKLTPWLSFHFHTYNWWNSCRNKAVVLSKATQAVTAWR